VWNLGDSEQKIGNPSRMMYEDEEWDMPVDRDTRLSVIYVRLITCMYYALTTLATVGYGDYYPCSISEKILGAII
jgi:hypothetical protein